MLVVVGGDLLGAVVDVEMNQQVVPISLFPP